MKKYIGIYLILCSVYACAAQKAWYRYNLTPTLKNMLINHISQPSFDPHRRYSTLGDFTPYEAFTLYALHQNDKQYSSELQQIADALQRKQPSVFALTSA